ncbi:hypothetical protein Pcinc_035346 [Petrolisthes cinctipes]|uniref:Uncharacterized protein n=2 Tax=Petrolisthes cinctipes TaxID=88211 RepID=A0AAE1BYG8_PETCI|nr:hypothetical protein Pcinc_035346 [Petrolisthes cinctipes]
MVPRSGGMQGGRMLQMSDATGTTTQQRRLTELDPMNTNTTPDQQQQQQQQQSLFQLSESGVLQLPSASFTPYELQEILQDEYGPKDLKKPVPQVQPKNPAYVTATSFDLDPTNESGVVVTGINNSCDYVALGRKDGDFGVKGRNGVGGVGGGGDCDIITEKNGNGGGGGGGVTGGNSGVDFDVIGRKKGDLGEDCVKVKPSNQRPLTQTTRPSTGYVAVLLSSDNGTQRVSNYVKVDDVEKYIHHTGTEVGGGDRGGYVVDGGGGGNVVNGVAIRGLERAREVGGGGYVVDEVAIRGLERGREVGGGDRGGYVVDEVAIRGLERAREVGGGGGGGGGNVVNGVAIRGLERGREKVGDDGTGRGGGGGRVKMGRGGQGIGGGGKVVRGGHGIGEGGKVGRGGQGIGGGGEVVTEGKSTNTPTTTTTTTTMTTGMGGGGSVYVGLDFFPLNGTPASTAQTPVVPSSPPPHPVHIQARESDSGSYATDYYPLSMMDLKFVGLGGQGQVGEKAGREAPLHKTEKGTKRETVGEDRKTPLHKTEKGNKRETVSEDRKTPLQKTEEGTKRETAGEDSADLTHSNSASLSSSLPVHTPLQQQQQSADTSCTNTSINGRCDINSCGDVSGEENQIISVDGVGQFSMGPSGYIMSVTPEFIDRVTKNSKNLFEPSSSMGCLETSDVQSQTGFSTQTTPPLMDIKGYIPHPVPTTQVAQVMDEVKDTSQSASLPGTEGNTTTLSISEPVVESDKVNHIQQCVLLKVAAAPQSIPSSQITERDITHTSQLTDRNYSTYNSQPIPSHSTEKVNITHTSQPIPSHSTEKVNITHTSQLIPPHSTEKVNITHTSQPIPPHSTEKVNITHTSQPIPSQITEKVNITHTSQTIPSHSTEKVNITHTSQLVPSQITERDMSNHIPIKRQSQCNNLDYVPLPEPSQMTEWKFAGPVFTQHQSPMMKRDNYYSGEGIRSNLNTNPHMTKNGIQPNTAEGVNAIHTPVHHMTQRITHTNLETKPKGIEPHMAPAHHTTHLTPTNLETTPKGIEPHMAPAHHTHTSNLETKPPHTTGEEKKLPHNNNTLPLSPHNNNNNNKNTSEGMKSEGVVGQCCKVAEWEDDVLRSAVDNDLVSFVKQHTPTHTPILNNNTQHTPTHTPTTNVSGGKVSISTLPFTGSLILGPDVLRAMFHDVEVLSRDVEVTRDDLEDLLLGDLGETMMPVDPEDLFLGDLGETTMPVDPEDLLLGDLGETMIPVDPEDLFLGDLGETMIPVDPKDLFLGDLGETMIPVDPEDLLLGDLGETMMPVDLDMTSDAPDLIFGPDKVMVENDNSMTSQTNKVIPETKKVIPETNKMIPDTDKVIPDTDKVIPETNTVIPGTNKVMPDTDKITSQTKKVIPETKKVMPDTDKITSQTKKVIPDTKKVIPDTKKVIPETNKITSQTNTVIPETKKVIPDTDKITPRPHKAQSDNEEESNVIKDNTNTHTHTHTPLPTGYSQVGGGGGKV